MLLVVSGVAGVLSVVAAMFAAVHVSLQCDLVTLAALTGYVIVAGRGTAPRVRWSLAAGVGLFAAVMGLRLAWYGGSTGDVRWFDTFYAPLDGSGARSAWEQVVPPALVKQWQREIDQERIRAAGQLLAVLCLAVAALALPVRSRPKRAALTTFVALALLAVLADDVRRLFHGVPVLGLLGTVWPALVAAVVAVVTLALTGWRADRAWLLPAGMLLVAMAAATAFDDVARAWSAWWSALHPRVVDAFLVVGVAVTPPPQASAAWEAAAALVGPALCVIGALRASRATRPVTA